MSIIIRVVNSLMKIVDESVLLEKLVMGMIRVMILLWMMEKFFMMFWRLFMLWKKFLDSFLVGWKL